MKTTRFFMYGLIILGILILTGGASAAITVTALPDQVSILEATNVNITVSVRCNVTLTGAGVAMGPTDTGADLWQVFSITPNTVGTIDVNADNTTETGYTTIQAGSTTRPRRYLIAEYTPEEALVGDEVTITVMDKTRGDPLDDVEVDIFLNKVKVAYGVTDKDGMFMFKPTEPGDYLVELDRSSYRSESLTIMVSGEAAATTTTTTVATTTTEAVTTTTEAVTTTIEPTTTTRVVITTTLPATTTTMEATTTTKAAEEEGGLPWIPIIIVVVIIVVIVAFVAMKGKGGAAEAAEEAPAAEAAEEAPAAEEATEEEI